MKKYVLCKTCVPRLSHYRNALLRFKDLGFDRVFSRTIAEAVGVTSAQVRKDFSIFGISGNKKGGYNVDTLIDQLYAILDKGSVHEVILVGIGNIGTALINYRLFEKEGIKIVAGFDIDPSKINKKNKISIFQLDDLEDFVKKNNIKIGIITVPAISARDVCDRMFSAGIKGILNFAPIQLKCREGFVVRNVNIMLELENVIYFVNALDEVINIE